MAYIDKDLYRSEPRDVWISAQPSPRYPGDSREMETVELKIHDSSDRISITMRPAQARQVAKMLAEGVEKFDRLFATNGKLTAYQCDGEIAVDLGDQAVNLTYEQARGFARLLEELADRAFEELVNNGEIEVEEEEGE